MSIIDFSGPGSGFGSGFGFSTGGVSIMGSSSPQPDKHNVILDSKHAAV